MQTKKAYAILPTWLIYTIIGILTLAVLVGILKFSANKVDDKSAEFLCRGSVAARDRVGVEVFGQDIARFPLLCRTITHQLPQKEKGTKQDVLQDLAEDIEQCYWQFGQGFSDEVFIDRDTVTKNDCIVCYRETIVESKSLPREPSNIIGINELYAYLGKTPIDVKDVSDSCKSGQGYCTDANKGDQCKSKVEDKFDITSTSGFEIDKNNKVCELKNAEESSCCYIPKNSCEGQGGSCVADKDTCESTGFNYPSWGCPGEQTCCVGRKQFTSYLDYIYGSDHGQIVITDPIVPGEQYAIAYGDKSDPCPFFCVSQWVAAGAVVGVAAGAILLAIPTGGGSLVAGGSYLVGSSVIAGSALVTGASFGAIANYGYDQSANWRHNEDIELPEPDGLVESLFTEREKGTIYVSHIDTIKDYCSVQEDVRGER